VWVRMKDGSGWGNGEGVWCEVMGWGKCGEDGEVVRRASGKGMGGVERNERQRRSGKK
jgi:hypothetical protein